MAENSSNFDLRSKGEEVAVAFLERRGYGTVDQNWSCSEGTIPIVAKDGDTVVFTDVKIRASVEGGFPEEPAEVVRAHWELMAALYLREHAGDYDGDFTIRFDVISILVISEDKAIVRHHINALNQD